MARERFIYPDIWSSPSFLKLTETAQLLWIGLFSTADDYGRGQGEPMSLAGRFFPTRGYTQAKMEAIITEVSAFGMVRFYEVENNLYYDIPKWEGYQRLRYRKASHVPLFAENSRKFTDTFATVTEKRSANVTLRRDTLRNDVATTPRVLAKFELYAKDLKLCARWDSLRKAWESAYPAVDLLAEMAKAHAWEISNPARRKLDKGRFLTRWFARVQENGGTPGYVPQLKREVPNVPVTKESIQELIARRQSASGNGSGAGDVPEEATRPERGILDLAEG